MSGVRVPPPASPFSAVFFALAGLSRRSSVRRSDPNGPQRTPSFVTFVSPSVSPGGELLGGSALEGSWRTGARPEARASTSRTRSRARRTTTPRRAAAASRPGAAARRHPVTGKPEWQKPVVKNRSRGARLARGRDARAPSTSRELAQRGPTLRGARRPVARRRRAGPHRPAPRPRQAVLRDDDRRRCAARWQYHVLPGVRPAGSPSEITEIDWQTLDRPARPRGPRRARRSRSTSRSPRTSTPGRPRRAAASSRATRSGSSSSRPNDEKPRLRVALAPEAAALLAALEPEDRLPYAIAFYAGLRRSEIYRLEWPDVLDGDRIATRAPRPPLQERGRHASAAHRSPTTSATVLADAWKRQGRPREGKVVDRSVMSGKIAARVDDGLGRAPASTGSRSTSAATPTPRC